MTAIAFVTDQHYDVSRRFEETVRVHKWIAEKIAERKPDVILLGGDIFERRSVPEDRNAAEQWLLSLAETAEVVAVVGNHELTNDCTIFNDLKAKHPITFYDRPTVHRVGDLNIACLPWPRKAQLLAAVTADIGPERLNEISSDLLTDVLRGLGVQARAAGGRTVFLGHVMMDGSKVATGQPLAPGMDFSLGLTNVGLVGAEAYFLGHIHMFQEWTINGAPCLYGGSSTRKTFGETEAKYFHIATLGDGPVTIEHIPTPCTPMLLFEGTFSENHGIVWQANESLPISSTEQPDIAALVKGAEVRVRYQTASDQREVAKVAIQDIERQMRNAGAVDVKIEEVVIPVTHARAPEITQVLAIKDQLPVLWKTMSDVPPLDRQDRLFAKLAQLEVEAQSL